MDHEIAIIDIRYNILMKKVVFFILIAILFYTRFVNLSWGLPYPMHPDERNMAVAVQQLSCPPLSSFITTHQTLTTCLNPHFFAYGQFPLYLAYGGIQIYYFITGINGQPTFIESTLALRTISALSSILLVFILLKISKLLFPKKKVSSFGFEFLALCIFIFQPYAIQFSHFGTTESLLMLLYSLIIYLSLKLLTTNFQLQTVCFLGLFSGLALGTKTSSVLFLGVPFIIFFIKIIGGSHGRASDSAHLAVKRGALAGWKMTDRIYCFYHLCIYSIILIFFFFLSSPQSFLNWTDFMSSMNYESGVGLGTYLPFYTRQFVGTIPVLFQFQNILPYALGWPTLIGGVLGFFLLPSGFYDFLRKVAVAGGFPTRADSRASREHWRDGKQLTESSALFDILRIALLLSFLPPSFFFAKWTRFIAPSFPLFSLFAFLFIIQIAEKYIKNIFFITIITVVTSIPGYSFLSVYTSPDVRFTASEWIYKNIPANSKILTETANVIDLPIPSANYELPTTNYQINSFNFYDLDTNHQLQMELSQALKGVDYIIIPSRRIFKNHPKNIYPQVAAYYEKLFSGTLGFEKVAEFSSYPRLEFQVLSFKFKKLFRGSCFV